MIHAVVFQGSIYHIHKYTTHLLSGVAIIGCNSAFLAQFFNTNFVWMWNKIYFTGYNTFQDLPT